MASATRVPSASLSAREPLGGKDQGPLFAAQWPPSCLLCLTEKGSQVVATSVSGKPFLQHVQHPYARCSGDVWRTSLAGHADRWVREALSTGLNQPGCSLHVFEGSLKLLKGMTTRWQVGCYSDSCSLTPFVSFPDILSVIK